MPRLPVPASIEAAPDASQPLLNQMKAQLGVAPNLFRLIATSPAALEGHLGLFGALSKGRLPAQTRERIALAIAQFNGCAYCLSAHSYVAANMAKLTLEEIAANRRGRSTDPRADAAVRFAVEVAESRGRVSDAALAEVRAAGHDDAQIVEIVQHVALNVWTNYLNELARIEIDFPVVDLDQAA